MSEPKTKPVDTGTMNALFVCTGNSCRSVLAEYLFRHHAARHHKAWGSKSCGIAADRTFAIPSGVQKALARYDILEIDHTPQLVSRKLADWATHIFAMTAGHRAVLENLYPEHRGKIFLFLEKAGLGPRDVEDPIGKPDERYAECCDLIDRGIKKIMGIDP